MSVEFPYLYSSTALMCLMGSIQGALYAVYTVRDWNQWKLGWNLYSINWGLCLLLWDLCYSMKSCI
ncbi:hypothetical protein Golax_002730 [Gossypium laxum]|uniref:Uncharacterized protein n=1 Tax=Gossypium laxum TaxID=34288 RepID=A0A7J9ASJ6_9ROSI|nr:hypothetical protein [Gossypium laxum]